MSSKHLFLLSAFMLCAGALLVGCDSRDSVKLEAPDGVNWDELKDRDRAMVEGFKGEGEE
ncbi:hypothetical protein SAMN06265222_103207 [Neorhodopirellula lusitana]|uniref:Secreted protein n=1 Tax=Neorhodopirellula lusitana TaxID=445327 RepID=A0ABY1PXK9_9BACT|nr:hypothetical protein [Neorhodopirellula lusitana]SMP51030.1 hypothetical protein SAMN06265222_103207 [Neorhodopirellula lusitana]